MGIESKHEYRFVYLKSEKWQHVRTGAMLREKGKCQICGEASYSNDAHHVYYPESFWETMQDHLIILCRPCHDLVHILVPKFSELEKEKAVTEWKRIQGALRTWRIQISDRFLDIENVSSAPKSLRDALKRYMKRVAELEERVKELESALPNLVDYSI